MNQKKYMIEMKDLAGISKKGFIFHDPGVYEVCVNGLLSLHALC